MPNTGTRATSRFCNECAAPMVVLTNDDGSLKMQGKRAVARCTNPGCLESIETSTMDLAYVKDPDD